MKQLRSAARTARRLRAALKEHARGCRKDVSYCDDCFLRDALIDVLRQVPLLANSVEVLLPPPSTRGTR